jgi:hypothetical protein
VREAVTVGLAVGVASAGAAVGRLQERMRHKHISRKLGCFNFNLVSFSWGDEDDWIIKSLVRVWLRSLGFDI